MLTGTVWSNTPPAAPPTSPPHWAFAVAGTVDRSAFGHSQTLTVRNLRTGDVAQVTTNDPSYALAFVNMSQQRGVELGDVLEIGVDGIDGTVHYVVTPEDLRRAVARVDLHRLAFLPTETQLLQNYPNPFNPETWIPYQLAEDSFVTLTIYDLTGKVVRTIEVGHKPADVYPSRDKVIYWDGRNSAGELVSSGSTFTT